MITGEEINWVALNSYIGLQLEYYFVSILLVLLIVLNLITWTLNYLDRGKLQ